MKDTDTLTVFSTHHERHRYGRPYDGGYVLCHHPLLGYDAFLSGGVSNENSFEIAVLDRYPDLVCEAFDPSGGAGAAHPRFHFTQAPVGYHGLDVARNALVKLDIERAEWPWLRGLTRVHLTHIAQLVMEMHSPHHECWDWSQLHRLVDTHVLVHFHANNWDGIVEVQGVRMPGTMETTWLRRDLAGETWLNMATIPGILDMANDPGRPDHVIDWPPFCWKDRP